MEHHPVADLFPMLPEDELKDLAHDIAERGLLQPIVLDTEGRILDGRNRYAACELASIEPEFETYEGGDPSGYALAVNVARRHLSKGQIAMVTTVARSQETWDLGDKARTAEAVGVSTERLRQARLVTEHAPELVENVIAGDSDWPLDKAYQEAVGRKKARDEGSAELAELRGLAPDLIVFVENGVRELNDALAEGRHRKTVHHIDQIRDSDGAPAPSFAQRVEEGSISWKEAAGLAQTWKEERDESIQRDQDRIRKITSGWGAVRTIRSKDGSSYVEAVLDGLGEADRIELDNILSELKAKR